MTDISRKWGRVTAFVLVFGPLLWSSGLLLRTLAVSSAGFTPDDVARFAAEPFAVREQLAAYAANPVLTVAGYAVFLAGAIILIPATAALAWLAARRSPVLAASGGALAILGLVARVYFAGVDHVAFQLATSQGLDAAATMVLDTYVDISYGPWRIAVVAAFGQYVGALLLAVGLYRAKIFGVVRALLFLWPATMWTGVLKTAGWWDVVASVLLLVVLTVLAVPWLRTGEPRSGPERGLRIW
ncbi:hypothetical protein [Actinoplanes sp. NPDC089786]|uniref:hypothetical protein n=1 Tax=Actinoplanes sp. NPDC089786 TaxID=3155185 RepID=UPI003427ED96